MKKIACYTSLMLSILFLSVGCSSDDSTKEGPGGGNAEGSFTPKGDWKLTVEDNEEPDTGFYTFSTNDEGVSNDRYGDVGYTKLSYKNKQLTMTLVDFEGYSVPSIVFDAPDPTATKFVTVQTYQDQDYYGNIKTYTSKITLERTTFPGKPQPEPEPEPQPVKSIEGIWEHSTQKYQLKIEGSKAIVYNLDQAPYFFPKKLVGDTFYDRIVKTGEQTWSADSYQWRFTDDDYENGHWEFEGSVILTLSDDGNQLFQGTRTFNRKG